MARSTLQVSATDGVRVSVALYQEPGRDAVIVICPGFFQSKETPTFRRLAQTLAQEHDVIAMDFRGHGRSGGLYTFSAREAADLGAVLRVAQARYEHIALMGFSLGAAITINTASRLRDRVRSLIAVSAPTAFEEIEFKWWTSQAMRTGLQGLEPGVGCRPGNLFLKKERPLDRVRDLSPIPILFIHGTHDVIVGVEHSRRLYAQAREPKRLEIIEGGGHAQTLFRDDPEGFVALVTGWLRETLPVGK